MREEREGGKGRGRERRMNENSATPRQIVREDQGRIVRGKKSLEQAPEQSKFINVYKFGKMTGSFTSHDLVHHSVRLTKSVCCGV